MIAALLFVLGLCFGSFVNALVWRTKQQAKSPKQRSESPTKLSILSGRSQCTNCGHSLSAIDLVPVLSWVTLKARCRYCGQKISAQYPVVEIIGSLVFVLSYFFWPTQIVGGQLVLFITWLATSVGLLALAVYDAFWMLLPNRILYPTFIVALGGRLVYILFFASDKAHNFWLLALGLLVSSGIFWLIFELSRGKWIGFGDVRLGFITGALLADPLKSLLMIFIASLLGTFFVAPALLLKKKALGAHQPYGPFLITAAFIVILFGDQLINWYKNLII